MTIHQHILIFYYLQKINKTVSIKIKLIVRQSKDRLVTRSFQILEMKVGTKIKHFTLVVQFFNQKVCINIAIFKNQLVTFMGQDFCKNTNTHTRQIPNSSLYFNNLLSAVSDPYLKSLSTGRQRQIYASKLDDKFFADIKQIPSQFIQYLKCLAIQDRMFIDSFFQYSTQIYARSCNFSQLQWQRLSYLIQKQKGMKILTKNQKINNSICETILTKYNASKIVDLCMMLKNASQYKLLWEKIKPIYLPKYGFAYMIFCINGKQTQVIIDDFIPSHHFKSGITDPEILLLEKGFAKVLGCYEDIEKFKIGDLFQEISGIPALQEQDGALKENSSLSDQNILTCSISNLQSNSLLDFKDVMNMKQLVINRNSNQNQDSSQKQMISFQNGYRISSIDLQNWYPQSLVGNKMQYINVVSFSIKNSSTVSLRVSEMNKNFFKNQKTYSKISLRLLKKTQQGNIQCVSSKSISRKNQTYISNIYFKLCSGQFYLQVKSSEAVQNCQLILYAPMKIIFKQCSQNKIRKILEIQKTISQ